MSKIGAAYCRPGVGADWMCLAVKNRPAFVARFRTAQYVVGLRYTIATEMIKKRP